MPLVIIVAVGLILAFPLAISICALLGGSLVAFDRLTTRCPNCHVRRMKMTNGIRETYPTGRGTGRFYLCSACGKRAFWSNDNRAWENASASDFNWAYQVEVKR